MIKFFRKNRQKMLSENRFTKFLIYAIGEIMLVMIGILLALQVNDWHTEYNDRKEEKLLLAQLKDEYIQNIEHINRKFLLRNKLISSGESILDLIDRPNLNINSDSLNRLLSKTLTAATFEASLGVTNEVINSGKLYLIENDELRTMISGWTGKIESAVEVDLIWKDQRDRSYIPFLVENYQIRNVYNELLLDFEIFRKSDNETPDVHGLMGKSMNETDTELFLRNQELEDYISNMLALNYVANNLMKHLYKRTEKMIDLINKELDNV